MEFTTPLSRNEAILQNILGADNTLTEAQSRIEAILQAILYNEPYSDPAMSRIEELLLAIKDGGTWDKQTISRNEAILKAKLDGEEYTEDPQSRIEELLIEWCNSTPAGILKEVSGALITVTDALRRYADDLTVQITPVQSGSGDPAPDNIRAISGRTGAKIFHCGKNLLDTSTAAVTGGVVWFAEPEGILFKAGVTYKFSVPSATGSISIYDLTKTTQLAYGSTTSSISFTPSEDVYGLPRLYTSGGVPEEVYTQAQIESGSSVTEYEAYDGQKYSVSWENEAGTIYGGSLDLTTGVLTANYKLVDMDALAWSFVQPTTSIIYGTFYANANLEGAVKIKGVSNIISDIYKHATAWSADKSCKGNAANYTVYVVDSSFNGDVQAFTESVTGHYFCYEIEPTEYQLTPTQIQMFAGVNNIWADCGSSTLKYYGTEPALLGGLGGNLGGGLGLSLNPDTVPAVVPDVTDVVDSEEI